ncbi:MAG TPA: DUF1266 domain-containing protein [Patescibacteria group bacterium]|nr:DUF1266 domain-containing protein [Patescibacteria group bacterium]
MGLFRKKPKSVAPQYSPAQKWILAATALITLNKGDYPEWLGGDEPSDKIGKGMGKMLKYGWNINNAEDFNAILAWLAKEGHRAEFGDEVLAWDHMRYFYVCGMGYLAGYISEDQAWSQMMPLAKELQATYDSWHAMNEAYIKGRRMWGEDTDGTNLMEKDYKKMLEKQNTIWNSIAWDTHL